MESWAGVSAEDRFKHDPGHGRTRSASHQRERSQARLRSAHPSRAATTRRPRHGQSPAVAAISDSVIGDGAATGVDVTGDRVSAVGVVDTGSGGGRDGGQGRNAMCSTDHIDALEAEVGRLRAALAAVLNAAADGLGGTDVRSTGDQREH